MKGTRIEKEQKATRDLYEAGKKLAIIFGSSTRPVYKYAADNTAVTWTGGAAWGSLRLWEIRPNGDVEKVHVLFEDGEAVLKRGTLEQTERLLGRLTAAALRDLAKRAKDDPLAAIDMIAW